MKNPLCYQALENDCGSTTITNALLYLFERDEIPAELYRFINVYTVNCFEENGITKNMEFYDNINFFISTWIKQYAAKKNISLSCSYLQNLALDISKIKNCLNIGGCICLKTYRNGKSHFVLITNIDDENVYMFDPYYCETVNSENIVIDNKFFNYNRVVKINYFLKNEKVDLCLGPVSNREALLLVRTDIMPEIEFV